MIEGSHLAEIRNCEFSDMPDIERIHVSWKDIYRGQVPQIILVD